ncbi:hypothetical protein [Clostridium manihotivorum]|uniref:Uncharacterized protein n=1 Tax=Clostridium manihotivorum TaxID=2320868 RepID=A0A3R5U302_9CLOT|nr:hypothetical protein [Clostridium manihotivorum]QAA30325.1 hypothetical protein C1I91_00740 [Clostridium manihotivorum]
MAKYIKYKIIEDNYNTNSHFIYCENSNIPYITIKRLTKRYSYVEVDMVAFRPNQKLIKKIMCILNDHHSIYKVLSALKIINNHESLVTSLGSEVYGFKIKRQYDEQFASILFDLYYEALEKAKETLMEELECIQQ